MNTLDITVRDAATGPVVEISGDLDYASAPRLRAVLPTLDLRPGQRLVLDLAGLAFCDSSGITALIAARNRAQGQQADIALAAVPAGTLRVLAVIGLDQVIPLYPDSAAATAATAAP